MSTGGATQISSHYFQPRIGGDLAMVKGLLKQLLAWYDEARALATMRSHDQYNTTLYGLDDRYRGVWAQRRVVFFIHADDIKAQGFKAGDWVDLHTLRPLRPARKHGP